MKELKEKAVCCGKEMYHIKNCQSLMHSINAEIQQWVCLECGNYISLVEDQLDEEELDSLKANMDD